MFNIISADRFRRPWLLILLGMGLVIAGCTSQENAAVATALDRVGDVYQITIERTSESSGDSGTSGSTFDRNSLVERVVAMHDEAQELEFDLPDGTSAEDRARDWKFPARILKARGRPLELLNEAELEARLDAWLRAGWGDDGRQLCRRWVFTWTAVKIECDPQSVISVVQDFILAPTDLLEGMAYGEAGAIGKAPLRAERANGGPRTLVTELPVDGEMLLRQRAEADVIVAQLAGGSGMALRDAVISHEGERISGTVKIAFELDAAGQVTRRTRLIETLAIDSAGRTERSTVTEITRRELKVAPQSGTDR